MSSEASKVLVLTSQSGNNDDLVTVLRSAAVVHEIGSIDEAVEALRRDRYDAIFSDTADFLPLERALVKQQASLILNTLGEGVCIVDSAGHRIWSNRRMHDWPARVHENVRRICLDAFEYFNRQAQQPQAGTESLGTSRSKRYTMSLDDQLYFEVVASPVVNPAGQVVQIVAVIWDATAQRRLQQKIDAIDRAGRELMRMEIEQIKQMHLSERLKLLEEKIVRFTRELMHFDHFTIRVLDPKSRRLDLVICVGLPEEAKQFDLYASMEGNGISGYVAANGRSYICPDVEHDSRYVMGLDHAKSSLTVPLYLHDDNVIGVFNIENRRLAAFTEDDRQFAEIFGRYIAIALNTFNLLVSQSAAVRHKVADDVCGELAGPLNDISSDARALMEDYVGNEDLSARLQQILQNVDSIHAKLRPAAEGTHTVLGASEVRGEEDPLITRSRVLVADDDANIRSTISDILRKFRAEVTAASNGSEAIEHLGTCEFDLVISDIKMPDKSGYDVFAAAHLRNASLPVILMTGFGYDPAHSIVRASQEGLQAVLFKPFKVNQLLSEIRKALAQRAVR